MTWATRWADAVAEGALRIEDHTARGATADELLAALSIPSLARWTRRLGGRVTPRARLEQLLDAARARGPDTRWLATLARLRHELDHGNHTTAEGPWVAVGTALLREQLGLSPRFDGDAIVAAFEAAFAHELVTRAPALATARDSRAALDEVARTTPLLIRRLLEAVEERATATATLARWVANDDEGLAALGLESTGPIVRVTSSLGDAHGPLGGTSRVVFADDRSVVVRPFERAAEGVARDMIAWIHERLGEDVVVSPACVDRAGYQLRAWVERRAPLDQAEATAYLERFGHLMAVATVLGVEDLHVDNVVPAGGHPVVVDWECTLTPELARSRNLQAVVALEPPLAFARSVLRTGLLPSLTLAFGRGSAGESGLAAVLVEPLGRAMCGPLLADERAARAITAGFRDVITRLAPHLDELEALIVARLDDDYATRVLVRPTGVYQRLIAGADLAPAATHAIEELAHHDLLAERPLDGECSAIILAEVEATRRGHVPRFVVGADTTLPLVAGAHACTKERLARLASPAGLASEIDAIAWALALPARPTVGHRAATLVESLELAAQRLEHACAEVLHALGAIDTHAAIEPTAAHAERTYTELVALAKARLEQVEATGFRTGTRAIDIGAYRALASELGGLANAIRTVVP